MLFMQDEFCEALGCWVAVIFLRKCEPQQRRHPSLHSNMVVGGEQGHLCKNVNRTRDCLRA